MAVDEGEALGAVVGLVLEERDAEAAGRPVEEFEEALVEEVLRGPEQGVVEDDDGRLDPVEARRIAEVDVDGPDREAGVPADRRGVLLDGRGVGRAEVVEDEHAGRAEALLASAPGGGHGSPPLISGRLSRRRVRTPMAWARSPAVMRRATSTTSTPNPASDRPSSAPMEIVRSHRKITQKTA